MPDRLVYLFQKHFGRPPVSSAPVAADASGRRLIRYFDAEGRTAIGVIGENAEENRAFLSFTATFHALGLPVPACYGVTPDEQGYLIEDLGTRTLHAALQEARGRTGETFPESVVPQFLDAMAWLPRFQVEGGRAIDFSVASPRATFDKRAILWDLNHFKYLFLRLAHVPFDEDRLEDDLVRLAERMAAPQEEHFVYRDFQPRNVVLGDDGAVRFLDYQGGRQGPLPYDVASLLYSGSAALPAEARERLLVHYLEALGEYVDVDEAAWRERLPQFAFVRILQALGAYGYRGLYERKRGFAGRVGRGLDTLLELDAEHDVLRDLPALGDAIRLAAHDPTLRAPTPHPDARLTVKIGSFSYRHGLPETHSEHGGGYVFDCRALPNPGREPQYQGLSGLDASVGTMLAESAEAEAFLERVRSLIDAQVDAYLARGFTALDVRFGCTGGQHRSVYLAEALGTHLAKRTRDLRVVVEHAERARWPLSAARSMDSGSGRA